MSSEDNKPNDVELEQEILGSILVEEKLMKDLIDDVKPNDFYNEFHKKIFKAMAYLHHNNEHIDYSNLLARMKYKKELPETETDYVLSLSDTVISLSNLSNKVETLKELSGKRQIFELGEFLSSDDIQGVSSEQLRSKIESTLDTIKLTSNVEATHVSEYVDSWFNDLMSEEPAGVMLFGMKMLDNHILLKPKNLGIIAARPSLGKSAYALYIAVNFALQGKRTLFVSLEMDKSEVMDRMIARLARVEYKKISRKETFTNDEIKRIEESKKKVKELPLQIYDTGEFSVDHLFNYAKTLKKDNQIDAVLVDYLQLLESNKKSSSENDRVGYISRKLKLIAQELDVPVIALSQLSRASEQHQGGKKSVREPQLSDLRSSGSLEQDANYVVMLHSEDVDDKFEQVKHMKCFIRKNRSGKKGTIYMTYYGDYMSFDEVEEWGSDKQPKYAEQLDLENISQTYNEEDLPF